MSQQYASTQPAGFDNHIHNIAIVGATGQQGSYIVDHLLKTGTHTVTAITREKISGTFAEGIQVKKVDYNSQESIVAALKGQDALIITMNVRAPQETVAKLIEAAATAHVKWILPNEWGLDSNNKALGVETFLGPPRIADRALVEKLGVSSWIAVAGGFWYQYSLAIPSAYGFDIQGRAVTFYDDGMSKFNTSTWDQVARAVTALMSTKIYPDDKHDTSATLDTNFRNKFAFVSSFRVTQKDMFESLKRVTGTRDADWDITNRPSEEIYNEGMKEFKANPASGAYVKLLYARGLYPNGDGDFETKHGLANTVLRLPEEDLDECTKGAIDRSKK